MTRPSEMVIFRYSIFDVPVLRSVRIPSLITSFVRSAPIKAVDALSTFLTIRSSRMVALPVAEPPPIDDLPCMPHDQAKDLDLVLVLVVLRFAIDRAVLGAFDLEEHVAGAGRASLWIRDSVRH